MLDAYNYGNLISSTACTRYTNHVTRYFDVTTHVRQSHKYVIFTEHINSAHLISAQMISVFDVCEYLM